MGEGQKTELYSSPPHCQPGTAVQCPHFFIQVPDPKNIQTHTGATKVFLEGLVRGIRFFSKKNSLLVAD